MSSVVAAQDPNPVVAHRTSPTNVGLQLLAALSACDLAFISQWQCLHLLEHIFDTLTQLDRFNGHFFNCTPPLTQHTPAPLCSTEQLLLTLSLPLSPALPLCVCVAGYDTSSCEPLLPKYISMVDSGNLAGHLLVVKQWCLERLKVGAVPVNGRDGLIDTLVQLSREISRAKVVSMTAGGVSIQHLQDTITAAVEAVKGGRASTLAEWEDLLLSLLSHLRDAEDLINALSLDPTAAEKLSECSRWMALALSQVTEMQNDLPLLQSADGQKLWMERKAKVAQHCEDLFHAMDFKFLFDHQRKLFCIGFAVADNRLDNYHYESPALGHTHSTPLLVLRSSPASTLCCLACRVCSMLASESRLASFIAIAKGDVAQEHWFRMGRQLTAVGGSQALISWTASMFEYLMPLLVMRSFEKTLLHQTYHAVVARQVEYGKIQSVPWGISEAGYNARDLQMSYQYGPFGVPGLGLKRGLSEDLVVSPYSTMLAAMVDPIAALSNLKSLELLQAFSQFGMRESIDFTLKRLPAKSTRYVLQSYMAHHQGMSILSLDNVLNECIMQERFHRDPIVQATELLLQERVSATRPCTRHPACRPRHITALAHPSPFSVFSAVPPGAPQSFVVAASRRRGEAGGDELLLLVPPQPACVHGPFAAHPAHSAAE